jgi:hypothetical protein
VPIDLETMEAYLFAFSDQGKSFAVSVQGRTEAEARYRFNAMSRSEKRSRIVGALSLPERDLVAEFAAWFRRAFSRRPSARAA